MKVYIVKMDEYDTTETLGVYTVWGDIVTAFEGRSWLRDGLPYIEVWDLGVSHERAIKTVAMEMNRTLHVLNDSYSLTVIPD